ncbi:Electron transfer flavoprotein-ubiquinone oxidoreductase [Arabidopsis thaliana]
MHRFLVKLSSSSSPFSNQLRSLKNQRLILPLLPSSKPFTSSSVSPPPSPLNASNRFGYPYSADLFRNLSPLNPNSRILGVNGITSSRCISSEAVRESIEYDVLIVGAGPAGLSAAIRLKQLSQEKNIDLSVCVVEKGAEVGGHIISGNVFEPLALDELLPHWRQEHAPIEIPASSDKFWFLTKDRAFSLPSPFDNKGNYVISLSQLVRWLGGKAEELGTEISWLFC